MIKVEHVTKRYGRTRALDDVSFAVERGQTVGILGPNGAGKTTTLRLLACFAAPTGGRILVDGLDVEEHSLAVRQRLGYLPENVALHADMRVREYLKFRGRLKGLRGKRLKGNVGEVMELCGLTDVGKRIVGHLSRGYRKRVGLADSLVHDPQLLILDEPTLGLDPTHARAIRSLIRTLAEARTIVLSTGNLAEAELLCPHVLILNAGRVVASGAPRKLAAASATSTHVVVDVQAPVQTVLSELERIPDILHISWESRDAWNRFALDCAPGRDIRADVFAVGARNGWPMRELGVRAHTLEEAFVALTAEAAHGGADGAAGSGAAGPTMPFSGGGPA